jgi:hypothetical protein
MWNQERRSGQVSKTSRFSVIVSQINDGHYKEPYSTLTASDVSVGEDGTLSINDDRGPRTLQASLWDEFTVKRPQAGCAPQA